MLSSCYENPKAMLSMCACAAHIHRVNVHKPTAATRTILRPIELASSHTISRTLSLSLSLTHIHDASILAASVRNTLFVSNIRAFSSSSLCSPKAVCAKLNCRYVALAPTRNHKKRK